jgi:hypothetical protein
MPNRGRSLAASDVYTWTQSGRHAILSAGRIAMLIIRDMRLVAEFRGYARGRCYVSTDGARCWQTDTTEEAACLDRPSARLYFDDKQREFVNVHGPWETAVQ